MLNIFEFQSSQISFQILFQFCILWGLANSIQIDMHELKGSAFLNWQFCPTLLKHSKNMEMFFFFHRHSRNESHFGLLSLHVIAHGQRDCLIYHWYDWPQREPRLLCRFDLFNYRLCLAARLSSWHASQPVGTLFFMPVCRQLNYY